MRVLLITPENRFIKAFRRGQFNNFAQLTMPYLAGFVRAPHRVTLVDEYNQTVDLDAPADLVGITCNTPNANHVYELADAFRRRGRLVVVLASTRNERLLAAAARAGCSCLFLGLESFSPESLRLANKAFNVVDSYQEGIARIHRHGITVQAGIVFGFDGDDESTFEATLRGATRAGLDGATVSILTPFPQTPIFEELQRAGRLLTSDWSYYNGKTAVAFRPARMSARQLWEGYLWFRRRFFAPGCILERVRRSGVRRLQSVILNLGYLRTVANRIPGQPIPRAMGGPCDQWPRRPAARAAPRFLK